MGGYRVRSKTPSRLCFLTASPQIHNRSLSSVQDELTEEEYEKQLKDVCMVLKAFEVSAELAEGVWFGGEMPRGPEYGEF